MKDNELFHVTLLTRKPAGDAYEGMYMESDVGREDAEGIARRRVALAPHGGRERYDLV